MEESLSKILQLALEQGIWAALYLYLAAEPDDV